MYRVHHLYANYGYKSFCDMLKTIGYRTYDIHLTHVTLTASHKTMPLNMRPTSSLFLELQATEYPSSMQ